MIVVKLLFLLFSVNCFAQNNFDQTTELLYNLTNYAIESRRSPNPCIYETNNVNYFSCLNKLTPYPPQNHFNNLYPQNYPLPYPVDRPQSVLEILSTISENDALRCVPRLLCELTSDTISKGRQSFTLPTLPFKIDMESIISVLAAMDLPGAPPVAAFGKAALLGYISKGNSDSCLNAYPRCPRDPNKLIQYLNNYNGGFFRYFNGINTRPYNYPQPYSNWAEKRIQTRPAHNYDVKFFDDREKFSRLTQTLAFPAVADDERFNEFTFKKPKELGYPINVYHSNELDLQRPLPNHQAAPVIFPTRTGTGELRLDPEELDANFKQKFYNLQNNNLISFEPTRYNEGSYYKTPQAPPFRELHSNKAIIFPF